MLICLYIWSRSYDIYLDLIIIFKAEAESEPFCRITVLHKQNHHHLYIVRDVLKYTFCTILLLACENHIKQTEHELADFGNRMPHFPVIKGW